MSLNETSILYSAISFLCGLIFHSYLHSYFRKKGENLATKEDIEEITNKIESVKSSIDITKSSHIDFITERKDMLLSFYDEVTTFRYELMAVNFGDFPFDEGQSLYKYQVKFLESVTNILKTNQRLSIYLEQNSELLIFSNEITKSALECRTVVKENFGKIKETSIKETLAHFAIERDGRENYISAVEKANVANTRYWRSMKPHIDSLIESYEGYLTALYSDFHSRQMQINK